jgi:hypothetical protein
MKSPACQLFQEITVNRPTIPKASSFYDDDGFKQGFPWLFYQRDATSVLYAPKRIKFRASFNEENLAVGIISDLNFKLGKYELDGTFLGYEDLTD